MRDQLNRFVSEYSKESKQPFAGNTYGQFVRDDIPKAIANAVNLADDKYLVVGSVGQGGWAKVPWICIFNRAITTSATKGVYIVYLLSVDTQRLYLTFNQGCTELRKNYSKKETIKKMREIADGISAAIDSRMFNTDENIILGPGFTELGELYQRGTIFYKQYEADNLPSNEELKSDLNNMLDIYDDYVSLMENLGEGNEPMNTSDIYSWIIIDATTVRKKCDKSFWKYKTTGLPKDICPFFGVEKMVPGERKSCILVFDGETYDATISRQIEPHSSTYLTWKKDLDERFHLYEHSTQDVVAEFQRVDNDKYQVTFLIEDTETEKAKQPMFNIPHNIILYGPPGTGKTYYTVEMAVGLCDGLSDDDIRLTGHAELLKRYEQLVDEGRIMFTTFHQSYGYEEFIEGIRPVMGSDDGPGDLKYEIQDGIFKRICKAAETPDSPEIDHNASIWFVRLKDGSNNDLKQNCFANNVIRFNAPKEIIESDRWLYDRISSMKPGDFVVSYAGPEKIDAVGIVEGEECYFDSQKPSYNWTLKVKWLIKEVPIDVRSINNNKYLPNFQIALMKHMKLSDLLHVVENNGGTRYSKNDKAYVLIIDEINRGNISKIFGELITLIEDTKREGASDAMSAILPYSGERFSVPDNVYILGTMNTADRSIALMDTALRRRFTFVEKMPDSGVLDQLGASTISENGKTLSVSKTLDLMNERITYLYDREHTIGHAYFTELAENKSIKHLGQIFEKHIIPLLQEYFYDDFEKIQLVLGDNQKSDDSLKIVLDRRIKENDLFNGNPDLGLSEIAYDIQVEALQNIDTYKEIGEDL